MPEGAPSAGELHPARLPVAELLRACDTRRQRRSGPGGQHRNKVETGIVLSHRPTQIQVSATERRSQQENLRVAIHRLRLALAARVRCPVDAANVPSPLWQSRCRNQKILVSTAHDDFPALLAEAMDVLAEHREDVRLAATALNCTPSQLVKLIQQDPHAWAAFNQRRADRGMSPLK